MPPPVVGSVEGEYEYGVNTLLKLLYGGAVLHWARKINHHVTQFKQNLSSSEKIGIGGY
jgi:hypothetical protein